MHEKQNQTIMNLAMFFLMFGQGDKGGGGGFQFDFSTRINDRCFLYVYDPAPG